MNKKKRKMTEFVKGLLDDTGSGLDSLNEAIALAKTRGLDPAHQTLFYDGIIKRFETLFTKTSNLLRFALSEEGTETVSPKQVISESARLNWIKDVDFWLIALDARASTINKISDLTRKEYLNIIAQFALEVEVIINLLTELRAE